MREEEQIWRGWGEDLKFNFRLFKFDMFIRPQSIDVEKVVRFILGFRGHIHPEEINMRVINILVAFFNIRFHEVIEGVRIHRKN